MTNETLQRGKEITANVTNLVDAKGLWEKAQGINELKLDVDGWQFAKEIGCVKMINFEALRELTLSAINKRIAELETEFKNL